MIPNKLILSIVILIVIIDLSKSYQNKMTSFCLKFIRAYKFLKNNIFLFCESANYKKMSKSNTNQFNECVIISSDKISFEYKDLR